MQVRALRLALGACAVLALGAAAAAQDVRPRGRHRLGPAWVTLRLQLKQAGVDTNVFQTLVNPVRDEEIVTGVQGDGVLPVGRRLELRGSGFVEHHAYRRQGEQGSTDFYGEGRVQLELGPLQLMGGGSGGQFTERFSIDIDERVPRQEKLGYAGAVWSLSHRWSLTARATGAVVTFSPGSFRLGGDIKEALDRNTLTATGQLRHTLTPRTTLVVSADVLEDRFTSQPPDLPRVRRSYRYLGGLELGERARVSGKLLAGVRQFPGTLEQGSPPYTGPTVACDLTLPLGHNAHLQFQGLRDVLYASSLVELGELHYRNAFVYGRYWGEAFLPLTQGGLATQLSVGFETADYLLPHPYLQPGFFADRVDHRFTAGAGLTQRLGSTLRVGGHVFWARRVSTLALFSYDGLRYGVSAELIP